MHHFAYWAKVVQTFCPVTTHSSPSLTARVFSEARSEPDSGSENPWHQISSPVRIGSRLRSFCSSLPWVITTGPPMTRPRTLAGCGAPRRASSSLKIACSISVAPRPPYSFGHDRPVQPPSCSCFCHVRANSNQSSSPRGGRPGLLASSQPRSSSLNACSEGESVRSKAGRTLTVRLGPLALALRVLLGLLELGLDHVALVVDL